MELYNNADVSKQENSYCRACTHRAMQLGAVLSTSQAPNNCNFIGAALFILTFSDIFSDFYYFFIGHRSQDFLLSTNLLAWLLHQADKMNRILQLTLNFINKIQFFSGFHFNNIFAKYYNNLCLIITQHINETLLMLC